MDLGTSVKTYTEGGLEFFVYKVMSYCHPLLITHLDDALETFSTLGSATNITLNELSKIIKSGNLIR